VGRTVPYSLLSSPEAAVGAVIEQTPLGRLGEVSDMADAVVTKRKVSGGTISEAGRQTHGK
jgi:hypothetical protein